MRRPHVIFLSALLLHLLPDLATCQATCSVCQFVADGVLGRMAAGDSISEQNNVIKASVCPSLEESFDCTGAIEAGLWDSVVAAVAAKPDAAVGACEAARCLQWPGEATKWSCAGCRGRVGDVGSSSFNSSAVSILRAYLTGPALCEHEEQCVEFLDLALQPALKAVAEYINADSRKVCDESFSSVCSLAQSACEPRASSLLSTLSRPSEVAAQQQLLLSEVCASEDVVDEGRQDDCDAFVNDQWGAVMAAVDGNADEFAKGICYALEVEFFPSSAFDCLTCERELVSAAAAMGSDAAIAGLTSYLSGAAFCATVADPLGCRQDIGPFLQLAVPVLTAALAEDARNFCGNYSDCS